MTDLGRWTALLAFGVLLGLLPAVEPAPEGSPEPATATAATSPTLPASATEMTPPSHAPLSPTPLQGWENFPYDGRFVFARIRFEVNLRGGFFGGGPEPPWAHDFPRAERNLMRILGETTAVDPWLAGGNIVDLDDPELFRYPIAYLVEPGFWTPEEDEVENLRAWFRKGGFLIVDDFRGPHIYNFEQQMRRVLPGLQFFPLGVEHPLFHTFFEIESLEFEAPTFQQYQPVYLAIYENNDPSGRLPAVVNYNNDIGDYWEWSDSGFLPIDLSNEAYKLGVNYLVWGLTR